MQKQTPTTSHIATGKAEVKSSFGKMTHSRRKSLDGETSATNSRTSSALEDDHFSFVSAITMDDALVVSDRLTLSDRYQYRLDPRLHSLAEQSWVDGMEELEHQVVFVPAITMDDPLAVSDRLTLSDRYQYRLDPRLHSLAEQRRVDGMEALEQDGMLDDCSLPATNYNRFTDMSEGADTAPCSVPCRRLSMSYRSSCSADLENTKSSSSNLDLHNASFGTKSSATDLNYRSSGQWGDSSNFFLEEEDLSGCASSYNDEAYVDENEDDGSASSYERLVGDLGGLEDHFERVVLKSESVPHEVPHTAKPRRSYRNNHNIVLPGSTKGTSTGYSRTAISSQSLDLLDIFGEERCK